MKNFDKTPVEIEQFQKHIEERLAKSVSSEGRDVSALLKKVTVAIENPAAILPCDFIEFDSASLLQLLKYSHHFYLLRSLPEIELGLFRLAALDFGKERNARHIFYLKAFEKYKAHLEAHINYEERYVFPYIDCLIKGQHEIDRLSPQFSSLADFYINHTDTEKDLERIIQLMQEELDQFPEGIVRMVLQKMRSLYLDLYLHGKIEEEVLIPRMIRLENGN